MKLINHINQDLDAFEKKSSSWITRCGFLSQKGWNALFGLMPLGCAWWSVLFLCSLSSSSTCVGNTSRTYMLWIASFECLYFWWQNKRDAIYRSPSKIFIFNAISASATGSSTLTNPPSFARPVQGTSASRGHTRSLSVWVEYEHFRKLLEAAEVLQWPKSWSLSSD